MTQLLSEPSEQPAPEMLANFGDVLNTSDIAEITGLSKQTIRAHALAGKIPMKRIGHFWYITRHRFIEYMET